MQIIMSSNPHLSTKDGQKITKSNQSVVSKCRVHRYGLRPLPVANTSRKFEQIICTKCGLVVDTWERSEKAQIDKLVKDVERITKFLNTTSGVPEKK